VAAFNPMTAQNIALFKAFLSGECGLNGFRHHHLQNKLFDSKPKDAAVVKRRIHRTSRLIAKLRSHCSINKVQNIRRYRVSHHGYGSMWAAVLSDLDTSACATSRSVQQVVVEQQSGK